MLTEEERDYLEKVLKFGNYVSGNGNGVIKYVVKRGYWLHLCFSPFHSNGIYIDKNLYFKGLNEDEEYTLHELKVKVEKMIIDFFTKKEVKFDYTCDSCKYNLRNKKENGKVLENVIWCDAYISHRYKMGCSCNYYKFKYEKLKEDL